MRAVVTAGQRREMIAYFSVIEWGLSALLALGAALIALKIFKLGPVWALVIGMVIFTALQFPITTHAVKLDMPPPRSN
jgi:hypothetical protein